MTEGALAGLCRLTVRLQDRVVDLAVPVDIPVADLLPAVLQFAGTEVEETGIEHGGWVLQQLGRPPLDEEATLGAIELRDGETLHLRPRAEAMPEAHFDDLIDGIATAMERHSGHWTDQTTRRLLRGLTGCLLGVVLVALILPGWAASERTLAAVTCAVLLYSVAAAASRALGDSASAALLGCSAVPFLALAGWAVPGGPTSGPLALEANGFRLLSAGAAATGAAVLALVVVGAFPQLFAATAVCCAFATTAGALTAGYELPMAHVAAAIALLAVTVGAFVPVIAFRVSGMQMRPLPTSPQQLQEGIEPYASEEVTARSVVAATWMTALYTAVGAVCTVSLALLAREAELAETLTGAVLSLLLLLHGRNLGSTRQRLAVLLPGFCGAVLLALGRASAEPTDRLTVFVALVLATGALTLAIWLIPGRRMVPYWGRAAELLHSLTAIALLPLVLWTLEVYSRLRNMTG
ncbi:type VII secretion integral membrane protein EccD [Streptomyces sp. NPDC005576]|uniref:type VII secretion integral membrane protein EccD n=1 Tax=Streptomyces sp. NPDC005576 TaxID=3364726 RepID=UPI0036C35BEA